MKSSEVINYGSCRFFQYLFTSVRTFFCNLGKKVLTLCPFAHIFHQPGTSVLIVLIVLCALKMSSNLPLSERLSQASCHTLNSFGSLRAFLPNTVTMNRVLLTESEHWVGSLALSLPKYLILPKSLYFC